MKMNETDISNPSMFKLGVPFPEAFNEHFSGQAYISQLLTTDVSIHNMTFSPACRTSWHVHHNYRQILLITGGRGWYQEWGKVPQALKPGDYVNIEPGVKHWHGAASDCWFSHLTVENHNEDARLEWFEPVTDVYFFKVEIMHVE